MSEVVQPVADASRKRSWLRRGIWLLLAVIILCAGAAAYVFRPMPLTAVPAFEGLKPSVDNGRYLAQISNCSACHTTSSGAAYSGGVTFKTDFGTIYSTNITPDRAHGIGGWSFADFYNAMKHGIRPGGAHLYPAFPYSHFAGMSDSDIASLYLFMQTLPPSARANQANDMQWPFGERRLLYFWKRLYHPYSPAEPVSGKSQAWQRGRYLTDAVAHCGACHTPRDWLGGPATGRALQGGRYIDRTALGHYRPWSAVDLTSGSRGLAGWSEEDIIAYLTIGKSRKAVVHGPMVEVFDATRKLTASDAKAVAAYLKSPPGSSSASSLRLPTLGQDEGAIVYAVHCGTCHLPDGRGDPILGISLRGNPIVQAKDPASLINVVLYGPDLPPPPFSTGRSNMKPFGKRLSDADIAALTSFLRRSFGNSASGVSEAQVRAQR